MSIPGGIGRRALTRADAVSSSQAETVSLSLLGAEIREDAPPS
jgi:hypothetical protein